jgi:adenosine deaminase CECR1
MPKGALLHVHLDATVDNVYLIELALKESAVHIRTPCAITATNSTTTWPEFRPFKETQLPQYTSITDAVYPGNIWVPLHQARSSFALGGPEGFDRWVIGAMSISSTEAYVTYNTIPKVQGRATVSPHALNSQTFQIWQKFESTFTTNGVTEFHDTRM